MPEIVEATEAELYAFFLQWENNARAGLCATPEQNAALTPEEIAKASAKGLMDWLKSI